MKNVIAVIVAKQLLIPQAKILETKKFWEELIDCFLPI
jgi:hypothetical protein